MGMCCGNREGSVGLNVVMPLACCRPLVLSFGCVRGSLDTFRRCPWLKLVIETRCVCGSCGGGWDNAVKSRKGSILKTAFCMKESIAWKFGLSSLDIFLLSSCRVSSPDN